MKTTYTIDPDADDARRVTLERHESPTGARYTVTVEDVEGDGEPRVLELDSARLPDGSWSVISEGRSMHFGANIDGSIVVGQLDGYTRVTEVLDARAMRKRSLGGGRKGASGPELIAAMAGKVIEVSVSVGALVEEGASVAIIEAMKMENVIKAHRGGVVASIHVEAGDTVAVGDQLLRIDEVEA